MTQPGFRRATLHVGEVNLHAAIGGAGPPLLLLHGFPQTWWAWRKVMPALAARHTVVAADLRGAGHSDCPAGGYDKATLAADMAGLMAGLGHDRFAVCGHDIGGMVAYALAATARARVTHLAVLDVPIPGVSLWDGLFADPRVWHFAFHMKRDLPELLIAGREYDYVAAFLHDRAYDPGAFAEQDLRAFARAFAMPGRVRGGLEWYRAFPKDAFDTRAWAAERLRIPVLALGGAERWGPVMVGMMRELAEDVRGGSVASCNHWLAEEQPEEVAARLLEFLS